MPTRRAIFKLLLLCVLLYAFFLGLDLMGLAFKLFGKGFAQTLVERTANPFVGLMVGVLATTLVQSSSTTTSMVVGMVAAGALTLEGAVPIILGANIGTSVTNTLVSLAHVTRREEFRRAFAGATVHDFFNWLSVLILMPLELAFGVLSKPALWLERALENAGGIELLNPLRTVVRPVAEGVEALLGNSPVLVLVAGVGLLFFALRYLVTLLKGLLAGPAEVMLHRTLFRSAPVAIAAGALITVMVQSSSITTSVIVPLVGAGVVTLEQLFPFTIGANLGTTITALLAALATGHPVAVTVALTHLLFNVAGSLLLYPLPAARRVPLALARWMGDLGSRNRPLAIAYIALAFFGMPLTLLLASGAFLPATAPAAVEAGSPPPAAPATALSTEEM